MNVTILLALIAISWIKMVWSVQAAYAVTNAQYSGIRPPSATTFEAVLPPLPYAFNAIEPVVDEETMRIHYSKHHQTYATKYNEFMTTLRNSNDPSFPSLLELGHIQQLRNLDRFPESVRTGVRNNLGGFVNHALFWPILKAPSQNNQPTQNSPLSTAITSQFGSFDKFQAEFNTNALALFGSGWTWAVVHCPSQGQTTAQIKIVNLPNQDFPQTGSPLLMLDVFEHAYYLKYRNDRASYVKNMWNVYNWPYLEEQFAKACP